MMYQQLLMQSLELGWDFYGPLLIFVGLIILGVPIWASIGVAAAVTIGLVHCRYLSSENHYSTVLIILL